MMASKVDSSFVGSEDDVRRPRPDDSRKCSTSQDGGESNSFHWWFVVVRLCVAVRRCVPIKFSCVLYGIGLGLSGIKCRLSFGSYIFVSNPFN